MGFLLRPKSMLTYYQLVQVHVDTQGLLHVVVLGISFGPLSAPLCLESVTSSDVPNILTEGGVDTQGKFHVQVTEGK